MVDAIIRGNLGSFWSAILDFYNQYHLLINGLILIYVVLVLLGKNCYQSIQNAIFHELYTTYGDAIKNKNQKWFHKALELQKLDWNRIVQYSWIPIISTENSLVFRLKTISFLKAHFNEEKLHNLILDLSSKE